MVIRLNSNPSNISDDFLNSAISPLKVVSFYTDFKLDESNVDSISTLTSASKKVYINSESDESIRNNSHSIKCSLIETFKFRFGGSLQNIIEKILHDSEDILQDYDLCIFLSAQEILKPDQLKRFLFHAGKSENLFQISRKLTLIDNLFVLPEDPNSKGILAWNLTNFKKLNSKGSHQTLNIEPEKVNSFVFNHNLNHSEKEVIQKSLAESSLAVPFHIDMYANARFKSECLISYLIPSRGRPKRLLTMLDSLYQTCDNPQNVEALIYVDHNDPEIKGYCSIAHELENRYPDFYRVRIIFEEQITVSYAWNRLSCFAKGRYMSMGNDDVIFRTQGWDTRLAEEIVSAASSGTQLTRVFYFNDGIHTTGHRTRFQSKSKSGRPPHCAFPIISRSWYEHIGYFSPEVFNFGFNDDWIHDIADQLHRLHPIPDVLAEHMHICIGKASLDQTYTEKQAREESLYTLDLPIFKRYKGLRKKHASMLLNLENSYRKPLSRRNWFMLNLYNILILWASRFRRMFVKIKSLKFSQK